MSVFVDAVVASTAAWPSLCMRPRTPTPSAPHSFIAAVDNNVTPLVGNYSIPKYFQSC